MDFIANRILMWKLKSSLRNAIASIGYTEYEAAATATLERVHEFNLWFNESWLRYSPSNLNYKMRDGRTFFMKFLIWKWFTQRAAIRALRSWFETTQKTFKIIRIVNTLRSHPPFLFWFYFQLFRRLLLVLHWRALLFWQKYWWVNE